MADGGGFISSTPAHLELNLLGGQKKGQGERPLTIFPRRCLAYVHNAHRDAAHNVRVEQDTNQPSPCLWPCSHPETSPLGHAGREGLSRCGRQQHSPHHPLGPFLPPMPTPLTPMPSPRTPHTRQHPVHL